MKNKLLTALFLFTALSIVLAGYFYSWGYAAGLLGLGVLAFIQNMAFTWVSRSRNSGDPAYHRYAAWGSNGIWMLTQGLVATNLTLPILKMAESGVNSEDMIKILATLLVYSVVTAEGSVFMMKLLLGRIKVPKWMNWLVENGNRQVGAR